MTLFTGPITETEHAALLAALGKGFPLVGQVLQAYRAGVRDGSQAAKPRVFHVGDPEPDKPTPLLGPDGDVEVWTPGEGRPGPVNSGETWPQYITEYGPLVEAPDFDTAIRADEQRRRGDGR